MKPPPDFPRRARAAMFDFDETMIDLEREHDAAHRALCAELGSDYGSLPETFRCGSGRRIVDDIAEIRRFFGWSEAEPDLYARRHAHFVAAFRRASQLRLMPGVESAVRGLAALGRKLAVTTSADASAVEELLRRFGVRQFFEVIVGGRDVDRGKPDPQAYVITAARLGVATDECLVFEDSEVGVLAAKRAGAYCIAVQNPHARIRQDVGAADLLLESMEEFDLGWLEARSD